MEWASHQTHSEHLPDKLKKKIKPQGREICTCACTCTKPLQHNTTRLHGWHAKKRLANTYLVILLHFYKHMRPVANDVVIVITSIVVIPAVVVAAVDVIDAVVSVVTIIVVS